MRTSAPALLPLFRSQSQVEMLGLLLLQPSRSWTLEELATSVGAPISSVHREVQRGVDAGILSRDARQRPHRYTAAASSPAFEPLRELLELTVGVPERLRQALSAVSGVRAAAIHGSWAAGRVGPTSDIDVIVVSDGDRRKAQRALREVGREIGRDVDATLVSTADFEEMLQAHNPFLTKILGGARTNLIGELDEVAPAA